MNDHLDPLDGQARAFDSDGVVFDVNPQQFAAMLQSNPRMFFGNNMTASDMNVRFEEGNLVLSGNFVYRGKPFQVTNATFSIVDGKLALEGNPEYDTLNINAQERGAVVRHMGTVLNGFNDTFQSSLNAQSPAGWEMRGVQEDDGTVGLRYSKVQQAAATPVAKDPSPDGAIDGDALESDADIELIEKERFFAFVRKTLSESERPMEPVEIRPIELAAVLKEKGMLLGAETEFSDMNIEMVNGQLIVRGSMPFNSRTLQPVITFDLNPSGLLMVSNTPGSISINNAGWDAQEVADIQQLFKNMGQELNGRLIVRSDREITSLPQWRTKGFYNENETLYIDYEKTVDDGGNLPNPDGAPGVGQRLDALDADQVVALGGELPEKNMLAAQVLRNLGLDIDPKSFGSHELELAAHKFKEDPTLFLQHGREYMRKLILDESLPIEKRRDRVSQALDEFIALQSELDHLAFPPTDDVRRGVPIYVTDGLVDMGSDSRPDAIDRGGREKILINKAELYKQFKPLLTEIFSDEAFAKLPRQDWKVAVTNMIASYVYENMPYNTQFNEHPDQRDRTVGLHNLLEEKLAVCRHHALASQVIFQTLGITSRLMKSDMSIDGGPFEPHANNVVRIDGEWKLFDSTNPYSGTATSVSEPFIRPLPGIAHNANINMNAYNYTFEFTDSVRPRTYRSRSNMFSQIRDTSST